MPIVYVHRVANRIDRKDYATSWDALQKYLKRYIEVPQAVYSPSDFRNSKARSGIGCLLGRSRSAIRVERYQPPEDSVDGTGSIRNLFSR